MDLQEWIENKYLDYQKQHGRLSMRKWSQVLGLSHGYLSNLMNGINTGVTMQTAYQIGERLNDFTILEVLGYPVPDRPLSGFSEEERELILSFLGKVKLAIANVPEDQRQNVIRSLLTSTDM